MIAFALLLATAAGPESREASVIAPNTLAITRTIVTTATAQVPQVIASAVVPYFRCIAARSGIAFSRAGQLVPAELDHASDCSVVRKTATDEADVLLKNAGIVSEQARWAQIAAALSSVESLITPPDGAK
jgi:hypothetical protein